LKAAEPFINGLNDRSRMSWEVHARFSEGPRVKFPRPTQPWKSGCFSAPEWGDSSKNSGILQLVGRVTWGINRVRFVQFLKSKHAIVTLVPHECPQLKQAWLMLIVKEW